MKTTPLSLAKAECANLMPDGCFDQSPCKLKTPGTRCGYFERAVAPYLDTQPKAYPRGSAPYWQAVAFASGQDPAPTLAAIQARKSALPLPTKGFSRKRARGGVQVPH